MDLAYYSLGEISKAKEEIKQTLKTNEKHGQALFQLGMTYGEDDHSLPMAVVYLTSTHFRRSARKIRQSHQIVLAHSKGYKVNRSDSTRQAPLSFS